MQANELVNDTTSYKIGNAFKLGGDMGSIVSGAISLGVGFSRAAIGGAEIATEAAVTTGAIIARSVGFALLGVGIVLGVSSGAYFTSKHCDELIEKFYNFYLNNADKISNSYIQADKYLELRSKVDGN